MYLVLSSPSLQKNSALDPAVKIQTPTYEKQKCVLGDLGTDAVNIDSTSSARPCPSFERKASLIMIPVCRGEVSVHTAKLLGRLRAVRLQTMQAWCQETGATCNTEIIDTNSVPLASKRGCCESMVVRVHSAIELVACHQASCMKCNRVRN
jgi:hypothetical protein